MILYQLFISFIHQADNDLGVLINLLYSTAEDFQPGTPTYTSMVNDKIISPGKSDSDCPSCTEEIAPSPIDVSTEEELEKTPGKSKNENEYELELQSDQYPCDANYIRLLLDQLNVAFWREFHL